MKKLIYILGITFLIIVLLLNLIYTSNLDREEHINITNNSIIYILGLILASILIYGVCFRIQKYFSSLHTMFIKKYIKIGCIISYTIISIVWVILVNPRVIGDSAHAASIAQLLNRGNITELLYSPTYANIPLGEYMQAYPQQINLGFAFSIFYRIIHFDTVMELLRILNILGNIAIVITVYLIQKQIAKQYSTNGTLSFICILTFFSIIMLGTFVYGDIPSLALCLLSIYTMMKYQETKKIYYSFIAMFCSMFACLFRMNSFIFVIATVIYLGLAIWNERINTTAKQKVKSMCILILYVVVSVIPSTVIPSYYLNKYNLDKEKMYPVESYLLMAMESGPRANGWYHEGIATNAIRNPKEAKKTYQKEIQDNIVYFIQNPRYTTCFYLSKIASMWTENTYSTIQNNIVKEDYSLEVITNPLNFYQKTMLIVICASSILGMLQYRKKISLEIIFLITIFIGGFTFHILWEAKSRYIIPYIVVLIPVASLFMPKWEKINNT